MVKSWIETYTVDGVGPHIGVIQGQMWRKLRAFMDANVPDWRREELALTSLDEADMAALAITKILAQAHPSQPASSPAPEDCSGRGDR